MSDSIAFDENVPEHAQLKKQVIDFLVSWTGEKADKFHEKYVLLHCLSPLMRELGYGDVERAFPVPCPTIGHVLHYAVNAK